MFSKVFAASTLVACAYAAVPGWHSGDGATNSGSGDFECTGAMGSTIKLVADPPTDSADTICPNADDINQALEVAIRHGLNNIDFPVDCVTGELWCGGGNVNRKVYITLNVKLDMKYTEVELEALYKQMDGNSIINELENAIEEFSSGLTNGEITAIVTQIGTALGGLSYSFLDEKPATTTTAAATSTTEVDAQIIPAAATDAKPLFATVAIAAAVTLAAFAL